MIAAKKGTHLGLRVLEPKDKAASFAKFNFKFGFRCAKCSNLVTTHFAKKADEMAYVNKDSEILLDRDLDK